jgi:hypothetical protein
MTNECILSILKKDWEKRYDPLKFDTAESFDPKLTTEGLVAGCGSLDLK